MPDTVRGTGHVLNVLDVLHRDQLALRIHDGAFSAMDLTARHPRTGELLSTVKFMVQTLAAAGEPQRELTYDGLRAADTEDCRGPRRVGGAVHHPDHRLGHRLLRLPRAELVPDPGQVALAVAVGR
ncbi:hypothetical protein [Streptomyces flaveolus]|uniref:hypothetical protein n=1 Tax=Streptomyces flaveolus TaxID=67297 RepID=UPI0037006016